ncbi:MAG TPA: alcohol dehydrogenase catalytic domain-containing protein [Micromonosporaceae bacterium]
MTAPAPTMTALRAVDGSATPVLRTLARPVAAADEAVLLVEAVSASHLDLQVLRGTAPGGSVGLPRTLGIDPVGIVVAVGSDADPALVGRRMVAKPNVFCGRCARCRAGNEADCTDQQILGVHRDGGAAGYVRVPVRALAGAPDDVPAAEIAAATHTFPVALHMMRVAEVTAGERVVVLGAAGAVGFAAAQLVALRGAETIGVVRGSARPTGHVTIEPADVAALSGIDVVIDATGDAALVTAALGTLAPRGRLVTCAGSGTLAVGMVDLFRKRLRLYGSAAADRSDLVSTMDLLARGEIHAPVAAVYELDDFEAAYAALARRERFGRVTFVPRTPVATTQERMEPHV